MPGYKAVLSIIVVAMLTAGISACADVHASGLDMAALDQMPAMVRSAPVTVRQAYQFAAANPDLMEGIPCYCGCGSIGHTSNYSCYVDANGAIDKHALGCSICVDITQAAMRLTRQGKTVTQIKAYMDAGYSKYGTSNMP